MSGDSILIIDDDEQLTDILSLVLEAEGYQVKCTAAPKQALDWLSEQAFSLVLLDLRLGDIDGLEVLPLIREAEPNIPVFIITAHGDVDSAVASLTQGASGYIRKPFREGELKSQIAQAIEKYRSRTDARLKRAVAREDDIRNLVRSRDPIMEPMLKKIAMAAQVNSSAVITGESGTGKELVARALHLHGPRKNGPFVALNCAALPESLLESELFGYVRGAFTDAKENKPGLFVRANGGTLFLDEIGDAPPSIQSKLLRVLQEREVLPLGSNTPVRIDVRVVAATHKSLQEEVAQGRFRQDLYYRLHVLPIHIPPLRERSRDILFLGALFGAELADQMHITFEGFTPQAQESLEKHLWPGNVRELQNRIEHAMAVSRGGRLSAGSLFPESVTHGAVKSDVASDLEPVSEPNSERQGAVAALPNATVPTFVEAKSSFEKNYLESILRIAKGNIARAARLASKSRTEVYGLLRKHQLDPATFKRTGSGTDSSSNE